MTEIRRKEVLVGPPIRQMRFDALSGRIVVYCEHAADHILMVISTDGMLVASYAACVKELVVSQRSCFILHGPMISMLTLDRSDEPPILVARSESQAVNFIACAGDGSFFASAEAGSQVLVTPSDERSPQQLFDAHSECVTAMAVSSVSNPAPNGNVLFTGARDGRLRKWNPLDVQKPLVDVAAHSSAITCIRLLSGDKLVLTVAVDNTMRIFSADLCESLMVVRMNRPPLMVREYQDMIYTFFDTGLFLRWNILRDFNEAFVPMHVAFSGHHGAVTDVVFKGSAVITSSLDATLRIWSVESRQCLAVLRAHQSPVTSCFLDADDRLFSSGDDGTLYCWQTSALLQTQSAQVRGDDLQPPLLSHILDRMRTVSGLIAAAVSHWFDPFLEAAAEREVDTQEATDAGNELQEDSREAEEKVISDLRFALRNTFSDADLWQIYNARSALHSLHLVFASVVVSFESCSHQYDEIARTIRKLLEEMIVSLEQNSSTNLKLFYAIACRFQGPRVKSVWERRTGRPIPHQLLRDLVTLLPDFLYSLLGPMVELIDKASESQRSSKNLLCESLAMLTRSWSLMRRLLSVFSLQQVNALWDASEVSVCQCELMNQKMPGFLGSLSPLLQTSPFSSCVDPGSDSNSLSCLLLDERIVSGDVFLPDLHELTSVESLASALDECDNREAIRHYLEQVLRFSGDASLHAIAAVVGPLLSRSGSVVEASLCALPCKMLLQNLPALLGGPVVNPSKILLTPSSEIISRVHVGHESDNAGFGGLFYSIHQSKLTKLKAICAPPAKPALIMGGRDSKQEVKGIRRASVILKKTFGAFEKRKSIKIETAPAFGRASAREMSPMEFANSLIADLDVEELSRTSSSASSTRSRRSQMRRSKPAFGWNELLGLVDGDSSSAASNTAADQVGEDEKGLVDFKPWDEDQSSGSLILNVDNSNPAEDEEIAPEIADFLRLDRVRESWRHAIDEDEDGVGGAAGGGLSEGASGGDAEQQSYQQADRLSESSDDLGASRSPRSSSNPPEKSQPVVPKKGLRESNSFGESLNHLAGVKRSKPLLGLSRGSNAPTGPDGGSANAALVTQSPNAPRKPPPRPPPAASPQQSVGRPEPPSGLRGVESPIAKRLPVPATPPPGGVNKRLSGSMKNSPIPPRRPSVVSPREVSGNIGSGTVTAAPAAAPGTPTTSGRPKPATPPNTRPTAPARDSSSGASMVRASGSSQPPKSAGANNRPPPRPK